MTIRCIDATSKISISVVEKVTFILALSTFSHNVRLCITTNACILVQSHVSGLKARGEHIKISSAHTSEAHTHTHTSEAYTHTSEAHTHTHLKRTHTHLKRTHTHTQTSEAYTHTSEAHAHTHTSEAHAHTHIWSARTHTHLKRTHTHTSEAHAHTHTHTSEAHAHRLCVNSVRILNWALLRFFFCAWMNKYRQNYIKMPILANILVNSQLSMCLNFKQLRKKRHVYQFIKSVLSFLKWKQTINKYNAVKEKKIALLLTK